MEANSITQNSSSYYLFDIDSDGVPELVYDHGNVSTGKELFYMSNGKLESHEMGPGTLQMIQNENKFLLSGSAQLYYTDDVYTFKNGVLTRVCYGDYHDDGNGMMYYWNGSQVDKSTYNNNLSKNFDSSKATSPSSYNSSSVLALINNY